MVARKEHFFSQVMDDFGFVIGFGTWRDVICGWIVLTTVWGVGGNFRNVCVCGWLGIGGGQCCAMVCLCRSKYSLQFGHEFVWCICVGDRHVGHVGICVCCMCLTRGMRRSQNGHLEGFPISRAGGGPPHLHCVMAGSVVKCCCV